MCCVLCKRQRTFKFHTMSVNYISIQATISFSGSTLLHGVSYFFITSHVYFVSSSVHTETVIIKCNLIFLSFLLAVSDLHWQQLTESGSVRQWITLCTCNTDVVIYSRKIQAKNIPFAKEPIYLSILRVLVVTSVNNETATARSDNTCHFLRISQYQTYVTFYIVSNHGRRWIC